MRVNQSVVETAGGCDCDLGCDSGWLRWSAPLSPRRRATRSQRNSIVSRAAAVSRVPGPALSRLPASRCGNEKASRATADPSGLAPASTVGNPIGVRPLVEELRPPMPGLPPLPVSPGMRTVPPVPRALEPPSPPGAVEPLVPPADVAPPAPRIEDPPAPASSLPAGVPPDACSAPVPLVVCSVSSPPVGEHALPSRLARTTLPDESANTTHAFIGLSHLEPIDFSDELCRAAPQDANQCSCPRT